METVAQDDILALGISVFKVIGEYKRHGTATFINIFRFINCCAYIWNLIIILGTIPYAYGYTYIRIMEGALSCSHALLKYLCFLYYKPDIEKLLDDLRSFWKISSNEEVYRPAKIIYKYLVIAQKVYMFAGFTVMIIYALRPWYEKDSRFVFACWPIFNSTVMETIVLFSQYYFLLIFVPIIYAYDNLYISYSVHVILQLRLLKYTLEHIEDGNIDDLYSCINQHQLLLSIFNRMKKIYFWMLLFHYFVTLVSGCSQLYILFLGAFLVPEVYYIKHAFLFLINIITTIFIFVIFRQPGAMEIIASIIYVAALIIEFGLYTFPVEEIVFELTDISRAIYMSTWYKKQLSAKRDLLFIMMKAQRQKYLSGGGLIDMNMDTFGSVARKMFSFYIILRNVLNK